MKTPITRHLGAAIFSLVLFAPILWMALDNTPPYIAIKGELIPDIVKPRDKIEIKWHIHVIRTGCIGFYQRIIVDSTNRVWTYKEMPSYFMNWSIGEYETTSPEPYTLPSGLSSGDAYTYSVMRFFCNPLQHWLQKPIQVTSPPIHFRVE